jgi:hypothetical protein
VAAIDLTSLDAAREFLGLQTAETELDEVLEATITRCSRELANEFEREFAPPVTAATRTLQFQPHPYGASWLVNLAPWDLRSVTSVIVDQGLTTQLTLTSSQWELAWHDRRTQTYLALELRDVLPDTNRRRRTLTVAGDWGLSEVPEDIELGCLLYVKTVMRLDVPAFGTSPALELLGSDDMAGENRRNPFPSGIPNRVLGLLSHYRRLGT